MKKGIFRQIGAGILNGFPMVQSIVKSIKGIKQDTAVPTNGEAPVNSGTQSQFSIVSLITELAVVALIGAFVTGKLSMEDLEKLIGIVKQ